MRLAGDSVPRPARGPAKKRVTARQRANPSIRKEGAAPSAAPRKPFNVAHAQAEVQRIAKAKAKPSRIKPLLGPFKDGSQHYLDTKTGATYMQRKTASDKQVQHAVIKLFRGASTAERDKARKQLEHIGVLGSNPAPAYRIKAIPHIVAPPEGLARAERSQLTATGKKPPVVYRLGNQQGALTKSGAFVPLRPELHGLGKVLHKGLFGGGGKVLGAIGAVSHVTGTAGRKAADALHLHGGGLAGGARLGLEIALDPTTYLTAGTGAELRGAARAAAAARDLEAAGVKIHDVEGFAALAHDAARTGDARPLAKALEDAKVHAPASGKTPSQQIAHEAAARGREAKVKGTAYLPHEEGQAAVTQRTLRAVKNMRRPGAHVGLATPTGGRRLVVKQLRTPAPVLKVTRHLAVTRGTKDFINANRLAAIRSEIVAKHAPALDAAEQQLKVAEDLGPAGTKDVAALRAQVADLARTRDTEIAHAVSAQERAPIKLESGAERMYRRNLANVSHTASLGAGELGRVTKANLERGVHDAIAPTVKEHGKGVELTAALERVALHLRANEAGGAAARDILTKLRPLSKGEQQTYDKLTTLYDQMARQGQAHGFLTDLVERFGGKRVATGRGADEAIQEMTSTASRAGTGSVSRHRTMPSAFDVASPTRTAADIQRVLGVTPEQAQRAGEALYQRGSTHFHAEQLAHQVQRGILPVHVDALHPQQVKAIAHWGKYQHFHGEPALFRDIADPAAEGHVLLNPHDKFEHFAPGTLSDQQKADQLAQDLHKATQMHDAALSAGDHAQAAEFAHVQQRLRSEQAALQVPHSAGQPVAVDAHSVAHVGADAHQPLAGPHEPPVNGNPVERVRNGEPRPEVQRYGQQEFEAGPHEDPLDIRNTGDLSFVLDPREANYYHSSAQARLVTATTRWKAVDHAFGRPSHVWTEVTGAGGEPVEKLVANPQLVKRGPDLWYDPKLNQEYMVPKIGNIPISDTIGKHQLWPTQVVASMTHELLTSGEFDQMYAHAAQSLLNRAMSQIRFGVTVPFPAYHLRNLATDVLISLQADSGVMFHPIVNSKLALAAFRTGKGAEVVVPGIGKMSLEDFTFFADAMGIRSGQHLADYARIVGKNSATPGRLRRWAQTTQHGAIALGSHREDVVRYATFVQRLRKNGGDAADAAWHMIQHHFDYNDLSLFEKRFMRNLFLFYTWYRKNIPLQFSELARRPGFFTAVGHTYEAMANGESPVNVNWSKLNPLLPDMSGALPKVQGLPTYVTDNLVAPGVNWNGHAAYFGFGAPWADMQLMSGAGLQQWISMLSPAINYPTALIFKKDPLTGRDLMANEPSGQANALDWIAHKLGFGPLKRDAKGRPVLPLALDLALREAPIFGRGGGAFTPTSSARDQGRLSTYGHVLGSTLFGVNPIVFPKKGTKGAALGRHNAIVGLLSDREKYYNERVNLPKDERDKEMRDYDLHVLLPTAHAQNITTYELRKTRGWSAGSTSTFYKKKGSGPTNFGIAGSSSSGAKNYGISGAGGKAKNFGVTP